MKDPFVEEIRASRQKHAECFNNNLDDIFNNIFEDQKKYYSKLVRRKAKYLTKKQKSNLIIAEEQAEYNSNQEKK